MIRQVNSTSAGGSGCCEENHDSVNPFLSKAYFTAEEHKMSLLPYVLMLWSGGHRKTRCPEGRLTGDLENSEM